MTGLQVVDPCLDAFQKAFRAELLAAVLGCGIAAGERVIDIPCGNGFYSALLASQMVDGLLVAADHSETCLAEAGRLLGTMKHGPKIVLRQANVYDLPPTPAALNLNPGDYPAEMDSPRVTLEGLGLTTRVLHSLKEEGIDSVDALCALSDRDLKKVPGIGERSLDEIKQQLAQFGLALRD